MNVVFRVDSSLQMGMGHLMRCLTLANVLKARGHTCFFICREHPGAQPGLLESAGHRVTLLPMESHELQGGEPHHASWLGASWQQDAARVRAAVQGRDVQWLVVDHYALDHRWEREVRSVAQHLMVIDDLADRAHCCDLLLDQNLGRQALDYQGLLPAKARLLIGPRHALLRPEFAELRASSLERRVRVQTLRKVLVTMGGIDLDNITERVLASLGTLRYEGLEVTVVMGYSSPWLSTVKQRAASMAMHVRVLSGVGNMAVLMSENDLCIGAAGSTSWERCCLGMPAILICLADNQREVIEALTLCGAVKSLDKTQFLDSPDSLIPLFEECQIKIRELSANSSNVTDGKGAESIACEMEYWID